MKIGTEASCAAIAHAIRAPGKTPATIALNRELLTFTVPV